MTLAPTVLDDEPPPTSKPPPPRPAPPARPALPPARPSAPPARPAEPPARPAPPPARPAPPSIPVKEETTEPETEPDRGGFSDIFGVTSPIASDLPISLSSGSLVGLVTSNSTTTSKDEKSKLHKLISQGSKSLEYPEGFDPLSESEKAWTNGSGEDDDDEDPEVLPPIPTCDIPAKPSLPPRQTSNDTQSGGSTAPGTPTKLPPVPKRAPPPPLPSRPPSGPPPALPAGRPPGGPPPPIPKR